MTITPISTDPVVVQSAKHDCRQLHPTAAVPHVLVTHSTSCAPPTRSTQIWPGSQVTPSHLKDAHGPALIDHRKLPQVATVRPPAEQLS